METQNENNYVAPKVIIVELQGQSIICTSQTEQTREEGFQAMISILDRKDRRPSAIFCANDTTALGVLSALKKKRHKNYFPSVISIDDIEEAQHTSPMLTTIAIPKREMAHLALTTLLDRRMGHHEEYIRIELPCHLMKRESCDYHYTS